MKVPRAILLTAAAVATVVSPIAAAAPARVSAPGRYSGYSAPVYDDVQRSSLYVPARDGTRLAVDVYRPTRGGKVETKPLPVIFQLTPYNRATRLPDGTIQPNIRQALGLAAYGYVVAVADVRGKGASFGTRSGPADDHELSDAAALVDWLGRQPWSSGKIGLNGCSYLGSTALQAARAPSRFVKAVFLGSSQFDQYGAFAPGGIASRGLADEVVSADSVVGVDADGDGSLKAAALAEHKGNTETGRFFAASPYRDDPNPYTNSNWWVQASLYPHLAEIRPDIGFYLHAGYFDPYGTQTILQYLNLPNPKKLAYGAWSHCESPHFRLDIERLRFFDHWLKGVDNGVMREPPVLIEVRHAQDGTELRALDRWPLDAVRTRYFLSPGPGPAHPAARGGPRLLIDASLSEASPAVGAAPVTLGRLPEVAPVVVYGYPVSGVEAYSANYTLPALPVGREIVGRPMARLWVASPEPDADIYVYLEAIHRQGGAEVISSGALRASHRKTGKAPYATGGVPWQTHLRADASPLRPGVPVELEIGLTATAYAIQPGDRLRLSVTTRSHRDTAAATPTITILSDSAHPSWVEIPDVDTRLRAIDPDLSLERSGRLPPLIGTRKANPARGY